MLCRICFLREICAQHGLLFFTLDAAEEVGAELANGFRIIKGKLRIHLSTFEMARLALRYDGKNVLNEINACGISRCTRVIGGDRCEARR